MVLERYKDKKAEEEKISRNTQRADRIMGMLVPATIQIIGMMARMTIHLCVMLISAFKRRR